MRAGSAMTWLARLIQLLPDGAGGTTGADALYRGAMALESADSPELAMTLEQYAKFLDSHGPFHRSRAPSRIAPPRIRKILVAALSPKMTLEASPIKMGPGMTASRHYCARSNPSIPKRRASFKIAGTVLLKLVVDRRRHRQEHRVVQRHGIRLG